MMTRGARGAKNEAREAKKNPHQGEGKKNFVDRRRNRHGDGMKRHGVREVRDIRFSQEIEHKEGKVCTFATHSPERAWQTSTTSYSLQYFF